MKIIELPREGMQSSPFIIPTRKKIEYINLLLKAGFHTVEMGSMASPKFVPQVADTVDVIRNLDLTGSKSKLMVLVLNTRGAEILSGLEQVDCISYPYSISPVFLKKNLNATQEKSFEDVRAIVEICRETKKEAVIYLSMTFGNPYGDEWSMDILRKHIGKLADAGAKVIPLSNVSVRIDEKMVRDVFIDVQKAFPDLEFGLHLHTDGKNQGALIDAALETGITRFDSVLHGLGGCPMTGGKMLGNLDTTYLLHHLEQKKINTNIDEQIFKRAGQMATKVFLPSE